MSRRVARAEESQVRPPVPRVSVRRRQSAGLPQLAEALRGSLREHHRFLLRQQLRTIERLEQTVGEFETRIDVKLSPVVSNAHLTLVPGDVANMGVAGSSPVSC